MSDVAVIQGKNGCHVEIDLTDSVLPDELQLDSVELTETQVSGYMYSYIPEQPLRKIDGGKLAALP